MTTPTTSDHAAVEALARDWSDEQWRDIFDDRAVSNDWPLHLLRRERWARLRADALAYLDATIESLHKRYGELDDWVVVSNVEALRTALGRAVLKRQQDKNVKGAD